MQWYRSFYPWRKIDREGPFYLRISEEDKKSEILNSFIKQYYAGTLFFQVS